MKSLLLVLFILYTPLLGYTQEVKQELFITQLNHYNSENGLSSNNIYHCMQDNEGMLWFSSDRGVSRFNGLKFNNYRIKDGLSDYEILSSYQDVQGKIWFASYNGSLTSFENGIFSQSDQSNYYTSNGPISKIVDLKDGLAVLPVSGETQVLNREKNEWQPFKTDSVNSTYIGIEYNAQNSKLLSIRKTEKRRNEIYIQYGNREITAKGKYLNLHQFDKTEHLLYLFKVFGDAIILEQYDLDNFELSKSTVLLELGKHIPLSLSIVDDFIMVGSRNGLFIYNRTTLNLVHNSYGELSITSILHSKDDSYWISTLESGVYQLKISRKEQHISPDPIHRLVSSHGRLFGCGEGIVIEYLNTGGLKKYSFNIGKDRITDIEVLGDDAILAVAGSGIFLWQEGRLKTNNFGGGLKDILKTNDSILIGSYNAIYTCRIEDLFRINFIPKKLTQVRANTIYKLKDKLYFGNEKGLYFLHNGVINAIDTISGRVNRITDTQKQVFYCTSNNGLKHMGQENWSMLKLETIHQINYSSEMIWLVLNSRIACYSITSQKITFLDLPIKGRLNDVYVLDSTLYVASSSGTYVYDTDQILNETEENLPSIFLEKVILNNHKSISIQDTSLSSTENDISFYFNTVFFNANAEVKFMYELINTEKSDSFHGSSTLGEISLYDLSPGNYRMKVWVDATNKKSTVLHYRFKIRPPIFQTWWFYTTLLIICSIAFFIIYQLRSANYRKEQQRIKAMHEYEQTALRAKMNPHFLFNVLHSIQQYFLKDDGLMGHKYLKKFADLVRQVLNNSDKTFATIEEEIDYINKYVELEKLRSNIKFEFIMIFNDWPKIAALKIPSMMIQPFIENSIWHAFDLNTEKPEINLKINLVNEQIEIEISDNGKGFDDQLIKYNKKEEHGISIVKDRLEVLKKIGYKKVSLTVDSIPLNGTLVKIIVPLKIEEL